MSDGMNCSRNHVVPARCTPGRRLGVLIVGWLAVAAPTSAISPVRAQTGEARPAAAECRPGGTSHYTGNDYTLLRDMLAYDDARGFFSIHVMTTMVLHLVQEVEYDSLKSLIRACAPQFVETPMRGAHPGGKSSWTARLTRSEVVIYDESENRRFSRDVVVRKTGAP